MIRSRVFVAVMLALTTTAVLRAQEDAPKTNNGKAVTGDMKLSLSNGMELRGNPMELESIKMTSLFGEVNVPVHTIAGIRFAQEPNEQTTVVLLNGDALTGEVNISDMRFVSDWGEATVNVGHLVSIVFRPDLAWSGVSTPNGKRWRLTKVQPRNQNNNNISGQVYRNGQTSSNRQFRTQ